MKSVSCTALADAIEEAARATPAAPLLAQLATGAPIDRLRSYAGHDQEARLVLDRLAAAPEPTTDLKAAALRHLATLEADYKIASPIRRGPIAASIVSALRELRQYFPPPAPAETPDQVLERLAALDADAVTKIEEKLPDRIDPKEIRP